ncbi:response regulator [Magnetofaba australis]|nr:response regulator [Magnetofaba australis]
MADTVVLLTDSAILNKIITSALDEERFEARLIASSEADFYDQIVEARPSLIFVRTELKNANGIEVCERIKGDKRLREAKVVFLSGNPQIREQAIQHRADQFLTLPFEKEDAEALVESLLPQAPTVLYVDDSEMFHRVVVPALRDEGYNVVEAYDGREALTMVDTNKVDIIVSDVEMPEMDGITLCHNVRATMEQDIPILLLTSLTSEEAVAKGFEAGADDYLAKPIVVAELISRIKRLLNTSSEQERPERILIVDDQEMIRTAMRNALSAQGFRLDEAKHGVEALTMVMKEKYDLLITDYEMPNLDGLELCIRIRNNEKGQERKLPIIFVTSRNSQADLVKIRSIGIQAFVSKPFTGDRVVAEVERVLAQQRLESQRKMFQNYLTHLSNHKVVDLYNQDGGVADDQFRTILYVDMVGFGGISRELPAPELVPFLNRYFDAICGILVRYDATIDKLINDGVYASFDRQADGAKRAVQAGLEIVNKLPDLHQKIGRTFKVRIGINAGRVILGNIGTNYRDRNITVIGENVEIAQQVGRQAGPNQVVITDEAAKVLEGAIGVEKLGEQTLYGGETMPIYAVKSLQAAEEE